MSPGGQNHPRLRTAPLKESLYLCESMFKVYIFFFNANNCPSNLFSSSSVFCSSVFKGRYIRALNLGLRRRGKMKGGSRSVIRRKTCFFLPSLVKGQFAVPLSMSESVVDSIWCSWGFSVQWLRTFGSGEGGVSLGGTESPRGSASVVLLQGAQRPPFQDCFEGPCRWLLICSSTDHVVLIFRRSGHWPWWWVLIPWFPPRPAPGAGLRAGGGQPESQAWRSPLQKVKVDPAVVGQGLAWAWAGS